MEKLLDTEDEVMLRDAARGFLEENAPLSAFRANRDAVRSYDPALWSEMAQMGWAGVLLPEEAGGADMGHRAAGILSEEMGKTLVASPFIASAVIAATALRDAGSDHLADIAAGQALYALAIDESAKFSPKHSALQARGEGNAFRLSGRKCFVADGASANRILVLARTSGSAGETQGLTLFNLDADRAGLNREAANSIDARDFATLDFDNVEATGDDVIGDVDNGLAAITPALQAGQAALAAELTGLSSGIAAITLGYLKERKQFGRTIGSFQALQHRAAHLFSEIEVTASAIANAGRVLDAGGSSDLAVSLAKARATQTAKLAVMEGVQMHGGIGMTDEYDAGFFMKRARVGAEWLGDYGYHAAIIAAHRGL
ncbi:acyl-CoA dehydrogenase family protein [Alisedimentitalea sp. MJ-SS2]|uniref:acyl-CoA dehydrogenase family protein n=1 Tax=Aliisedimentitalea sp. MJ-SS2 TaxID=3049795 RepID=UPI002911D1CE|nr:acyl-CoA dehydrogenase family protein [Alisedimentitalea sp. MJ-SS2]MDU8928138.1 acyl-CoA dehydrogenase family protein [Alisedimentitalea sp. MJ-SS2]